LGHARAREGTRTKEEGREREKKKEKKKEKSKRDTWLFYSNNIKYFIIP